MLERDFYISNRLADLQHIVPLHIAWLLVLIEASGSNKKSMSKQPIGKRFSMSRYTIQDSRLKG